MNTNLLELEIIIIQFLEKLAFDIANVSMRQDGVYIFL